MWRQVKGAGHLQGRELAVLEALAEWREATARERDLPKGFVLRDNTLLDLEPRRPARARGPRRSWACTRAPSAATATRCWR